MVTTVTSVTSVTIVFSINVHENLSFLRKQIKDIEANVLLDFVNIHDLPSDRFVYKTFRR